MVIFDRQTADEGHCRVIPVFCGHGIGSFFHGPPDIIHIGWLLFFIALINVMVVCNSDAWRKNELQLLQVMRLVCCFTSDMRKSSVNSFATSRCVLAMACSALLLPLGVIRPPVSTCVGS